MYKFFASLLGFGTQSVVEEKRELAVPLPKRNIVERDIDFVNVNIIYQDWFAGRYNEMREEQALLEMYPFLGGSANAEVATTSDESPYQAWRRNAERTQQVMNKLHPLNKK